MTKTLKKGAGNVSATRLVASTYGVLVGLAGIDHGIFEILQGSTKPAGLMIEAIGPGQRFWAYGTEPALTVIPNTLLTGILAVALGLLLVFWSARFVRTKHGALVFLLLGILLFLMGGGFAPIFVTILGFLTATRIDKPLAWWRKHVPGSLKAFLARLWPWSLLAFVLVFVVSVEIAVFGYPLVGLVGVDATMAVLSSLANWMLALMSLTPLAAFAHDIQAGRTKEPNLQPGAIA